MAMIEIHFPARRYHATPWGSHVNEGLIEWPPSPWRIVRALLATGYAKLSWNGVGPPDAARTLIENLCSSLPSYSLPSATGAHSRHYMPLGVLEKGREKTTLVLDTWAHVEAEAIFVRWSVSLSAEERRILADLAANLAYLGRSESWTAARLLTDSEEAVVDTEVVACDERPRPGREWEQVALLAPVSTSDYAAWREASVADAIECLTKSTKAQRKKIENDFPADLIASLQAETHWLKKVGWSQPPGSRKVLYWRKASALEVSPARRNMRTTKPANVTSILLAMATESGNNHALPPVTRTLPQAELLHRKFIAILTKSGASSNVLSGRDDHGNPLKSSHRHAHVIPIDLDLDGHLDHVLIWSPMGLDCDAQAAIRAARKTFTKGGTGPLRLAIAAEGSLTDFSRLPGIYGDGLRALVGPARTWRPLTPFVLPRHLKKNGRNTIEGQIGSECESRGLPPPNVTVLDVREPNVAQYRHFIRSRRFGPSPPANVGWAIQLSFPEPVAGPLALGYGCHFGLGLFHSGA